MRSLLSTVLLSIGLLVGLATSANATSQDRMLGYLPADALGVFVVDLQQLRQAPAFQHLHEILSKSDGYKSAFGALGDDSNLSEDRIHRIAFATLSTDTSSPRVLSIVHGEFTADELREAAQAQVEAQTDMEATSTDVFTHPQGALYVIGDGLFAVGTSAEVQALAESGAETSNRFSSALRDHVSAADQSASLWFAGRVNAEMRNLDPRIEDISGFSGHINIRNGLQIRLRVASESEETITRIVTDFEEQQEKLRQGSTADLLRSFGAMALVDGLSVSGESQSAIVSLQLDDERWMALVATVGALIESELR